MIKLNNNIITQEYLEYYKNIKNYNEKIATILLDINNYRGNFFNKLSEQLTKGDLYICYHNDNIIEPTINVDIKSCYMSKQTKRNTLAIDIEYFECNDIGLPLTDNLGRYIPYNQSNSKDSLGWIYHLILCDMLICINHKDNIVFTLEGFQSLRTNLINFHLDNHIPYYYLYLSEFISNDNKKKCTLTYYLNLDDTDIHDNLGIKVTRYDYKIQ